jgi:transglutaminase-like putative cysteine protease
LPVYAALLGVGALLAAGSAYGIALISRPRIDRLDPAVGEPGAIVRIEGRNFGKDRGESRVDVDGVAPTSSSYVSWAEDAISVRLPAAVDSGLVHVVTRAGRSNPKLFMNRARLPVRVEGERSARSGPFLEASSAESGPVGSLLVMSGLDFGANRGEGEVLFSWAYETGNSPMAERSGPALVSGSEGDLGYELWSDKEIRVRVPDGAASGALTVRTSKGRSNGLFFKVADAPGAKRFKDRRTYSISEAVSFTKVKSSGSNELYVWAPRPAVTASQRLARVLAQDPPPLVPLYRGTSLYRFKDLPAGKDFGILQSFLVEVYAVETDIDPDKVLAKPPNPPALMAVYLAPDERVPSGAAEIRSLAKKIAGGEPNPYRAATLIWDWLLKNIAWNPDWDKARPQDAIADKRADSYGYALLACSLLRAAGVPSLPVAGYLVDPSRHAVRHYWVEFYIYGLGWVPIDPVLGKGASPGGIDAAWEDRSRYFGNLDNRHLAFSRGSSVLAPMAPDGRRAAKERRWSFQSFYEEASGALDAYSSFWGDVEVTGLY